MARWRLTAKHYINATRHGEITQWMREETNRDTGRVARTLFNVPVYLDPDDPRDQNYPGEIIVAYEKGARPQDLVFTGEPTPDMEPVDEEAQKISDTTRPKWKHPIDSLSPTGGNYSEALLTLLSKQLEEAANKSGFAPRASGAIDEAAFKKMQEDMKALMESNAKLQAQLAVRPKV
jgi:hypothetical protein